MRAHPAARPPRVFVLGTTGALLAAAFTALLRGRHDTAADGT